MDDRKTEQTPENEAHLGAQSMPRVVVITIDQTPPQLVPDAVLQANNDGAASSQNA